MAFIGGCFGAYAVLRFLHYASAVTVNFIEVFTGGAQGNWQKSFLRLGAVAVYFLMLCLAAYLPGRVKSDLRLWAVWLDIVAAVAACLLPEAAGEGGIYILTCAMGFQWPVFAGEQGYPCATVFSSNNLRQFAAAWVQVRLNHETAFTGQMKLYGGTLLAYHGGVAAVCLLWRAAGHWSILVSLAAAALALAALRKTPHM